MMRACAWCDATTLPNVVTSCVCDVRVTPQEIVVTTTELKDSRDFHHNEVRIILSVHLAPHLGADISVLRVTKAFNHTHYGGPEYQVRVRPFFARTHERFVQKKFGDDSRPRCFCRELSWERTKKVS
jgi:hypothetical protein